MINKNKRVVIPSPELRLAAHGAVNLARAERPISLTTVFGGDVVIIHQIAGTRLDETK